MAVSAAEEGKHSKQAEQEGDHRAEIFSGSAPPDQSLWRRTGFWRRTRVLARVYLHPRTLGGVLGRFAGRGRPGQVVQGERVWLHDVYWLTNPRFGATASSFRGCQRTSCAANQLEIGRGADFRQSASNGRQTWPVRSKVRLLADAALRGSQFRGTSPRNSEQRLLADAATG